MPIRTKYLGYVRMIREKNNRTMNSKFENDDVADAELRMISNLHMKIARSE